MGAMAGGVTELVVADDASRKCLVEECPYLGTSTCTFRFHICCFPTECGCNKRFCKQHGFIPTSRLLTAAGAPMQLKQCCVYCAEELQKTEIVHQKRSCCCQLVFLLFFFIAMLTVGLSISYAWNNPVIFHDKRRKIGRKTWLQQLDTHWTT